MKKLISMLLALMLIGALSVCALADGVKYDSPDTMVKTWVRDGFPDYVCGVWQTFDGSNALTVAVLGEKYAQTVLDMAGNPVDGFTVTWGTGYTRSHKDLEAIQTEVGNYISTQYPSVTPSVRIDEQGNRVTVDLSDVEWQQEITEYLYNHYDGAVWVIVADEPLKSAPAVNGEMAFVPDYDPSEFDGLPAEDRGGSATMQTSDTGPEIVGAIEPVRGLGAINDRHFNPAWLMLILLPIVGVGYAVLTRRSAALQTVDGEVVSGSVMSTKEVENAVRSSTMKAPDGLEEKIRAGRK